MRDSSFDGVPTPDLQDYLFKSYRAATGTTKTARVLSSVHAICSPMTSWGLCILHINNDDEWPRDFSEALPEGISWDTGSNRIGSSITVVYI